MVIRQQVKSLGAIAALSLMVGGCASTATGSSQSAMLVTPGLVTFEKVAPATDALVVIRYPAASEEAANEAYFNAFSSRAIGGTSAVGNTEESQQLAKSLLVKSNYFAMSLYKELKERLPAGTVLLSPHAVTLDADGNLTSKPVSEAESIPSALSVDFVAYTFPDIEKMMDSEPITFGDLITPLVVVHADHRAAAPTNGVLLASSAIAGVSAKQSREAALSSFETIQSGGFENTVRPLDFISYLGGSGGIEAPTQGMSLVTEEHAVQVYPLEKIRLDAAVMTSLTSDSTVQIDPLEAKFSSSTADRIVDLLNSIDIEKAALMERATAISAYDSNIAPFALGGSTATDFESRYSLAKAMIQKERTVIASQSDKIFTASYEGEQGNSVREMIAGEYELLQERRKLANQQNMATGLAILGAVAAGAAASNGGDNFGSYAAMDLATDLTQLAVVQAFSLSAQSAAAGENYLVSMYEGMEQQIEVQIDLLDGSETITAATVSELKEKLQDLYSVKYREMDEIASECGFAYGGADGGRWLGSCADGIGNGRGVGAVKLEDGRAVEYYGSAEAGIPNGVGYMIVHGSDSTLSMEGNFIDGKADGVVRISQAGAADQLIIYEAGVVAGPAPEGSDAPRLFAPEEVLAMLNIAKG